MRNRKGFTLIELMVVLTIIAILATIALFGIGKAQAAARDAKRQQIMNGYRTALERFYADYQGYPAYAAGSNAFYYMTYTLQGNNPAGVFSPAPTAYLPGVWGTTPGDPLNNVWLCAGANGNPCAPVAGGPVFYNYTVGGCNGNLCQTYVLTLTKEAGGTSTFTSPQ